MAKTSVIKEHKVDTKSVLAALDIGYEFKPNKTFSIKPYALFGFERMDVDFTQYFNRYLGNIDLVRSETKSETQNVFALGGGVRMIGFVTADPANGPNTTPVDVALILFFAFIVYIIKSLAFGTSYSLIGMTENLAYLAYRETVRESREINKRDG